jgi:metacaspase-1
MQDNVSNSGKTGSPQTESNENMDCNSRARVPKKLIARAKDYIAAKVVLFSACQDHQKTAGIDNVRKLRLSFVPDGTKGGACTSLFLQVLYHDFKLRQEFDRRLNKIDVGDELVNNSLVEKPAPMTYGKVLTHMQRVCERNMYTQVPLLSSSRPLQMHKDPFQIVPDNFNKKTGNGTKRALIIGINYTNSPYALPGCQNDCRNVIAFLKQVHDFEDEYITLLIDDPVACDEDHLPTKRNIMRSFRTFAMQCQEGDAVFVHYAGHGIAVEDQSGDEPDGFDGALLPVDYLTAGEILDDEIFQLLLIPMPKNVVVTALFDCCHSGTILDLPFEYSVEKPECDYDLVKFPHMHMVKEYRNNMARVKNWHDIQEPKSGAKHSHSPIKHQPRGRPKTRSRTRTRVAGFMDCSMNKCKAIEERNDATKTPEPRICRLPQQKQASMQDNDTNTPLSPQQDTVSIGKLVSKANIGSFSPGTPKKKHPKKAIKSHSSPDTPATRNLNPEQIIPQQNRWLKRRSKSQPPIMNCHAKLNRQAGKSKSPLSFPRFFDSSPHTPVEKTPRKKSNVSGFAQKIDSPERESLKAQQRQRTPIREHKTRVSRSPSTTRRRIPAVQSPYPDKGRANLRMALYPSPRSPKRGRHATTFGYPASHASPPKIIDIPVLRL